MLIRRENPYVVFGKISGEVIPSERIRLKAEEQKVSARAALEAICFVRQRRIFP